MTTIELSRDKIKLTEQLSEEAQEVDRLEYALLSATENKRHTEMLLKLIDEDPEDYARRKNFDAYQDELLMQFRAKCYPISKTDSVLIHHLNLNP